VVGVDKHSLVVEVELVDTGVQYLANLLELTHPPKRLYLFYLELLILSQLAVAGHPQL
jgi:hypothetical protein